MDVVKEHPNPFGTTDGARGAKLLALVSISDPENAKAVASRIKQARRKAGLNRDDLAELLEVHRKTIANWESPSAPTFPRDKLNELARALNVDVPWILYGDSVLTEPDLRSVLDQLVKVMTRIEKRLPPDVD